MAGALSGHSMQVLTGGKCQNDMEIGKEYRADSDVGVGMGPLN